MDFLPNFYHDTINYGFLRKFYPNTIDYGFWPYFPIIILWTTKKMFYFNHHIINHLKMFNCNHHINKNQKLFHCFIIILYSENDELFLKVTQAYSGKRNPSAPIRSRT